MFHFNFQKMLQSAGVLFRAQSPAKEMEIIRLVKLLYIADRKCMEKSGNPIIGDRIVAMKYGPVPSRTYDIIKGEDTESEKWDRYFEKIQNTIKLRQSPGLGSLSKFEIEILQGVHERFEHMGEFDIVEETHDYPEWKNNPPGDSSCPIPYEDILDAVGLGDKIDSIREDIESVEFMRQLIR